MRIQNIIGFVMVMVTTVFVLPADVSRAEVDVVTGTAFYAAGDIACAPNDTTDPCHQLATSDIIRNDGDFDGSTNRVLAIGDEQYEHGELADFNQVYDTAWGASPPGSRVSFKSITKPVPGNHEYEDPALPGPAQGYRDYWGAQAKWNSSCTGCGYYSFDVAGWHIVALNTECDQFPGAPTCSGEVTWLHNDLTTNSSTCELVYGHRPRWAKGGNNGYLGGLWTEAVNDGVDLWLAGHIHNYQRYPLMDANGNSSPTSGTREIVVGTGGRSHGTLGTGGPPAAPQFTDDTHFGVDKIILGTGQYSVTFIGEGGAVIDATTNKTCH